MVRRRRARCSFRSNTIRNRLMTAAPSTRPPRNWSNGSRAEVLRSPNNDAPRLNALAGAWECPTDRRRPPVERPEVLRREVKALVFDQYGTIVDMQGRLTEAVTPFLEGKGWKGDPHQFVTWWRRTHYENSMIDALCDRGHTPYRQIGHRAVSHVMDRAGISYSHDEGRWLLAQIEPLRPFPRDVTD